LALVLAGGLASAAAASAGPATPAEYTVNDTTDAALSNSAGRACVSTHGGSCTLRAAVQAADNTGGVSTITLPAGDYKLTIPSTTDDEPANGDLDIKGVSTAITLTGGGATSTIIDANHIDRAFAVQSGEGLTISGVTVRNGAQPNTAPSNESTSPGEGGAFVNEGSLTIEHSALSGNSAATAGGAVTAGPEATSTSIIDSTAEHNSSDGEGGVMRADSGNVTFTGDTVTHNTSKSDGAVLEYDKSGTAGAVTVTGSTISHNTADSDGGAFYVIEASSLTVSASTLDSNSTDDDYGGAIYAEGLASLTVEGSTLSSNSSGDTEGGAIYAYNDGTLAVSGSVFDGDSSGDGDGGAIAAEETNLTMSGSSFSGDQGEEGGAAYVDGTGPAALQSITTSTFADNEATSSEGGALYDEKGNLQLSDSTFNANNASDAGGALYYGSSDGLTVTNDTFDGNQTGEEGGAIDLNEPATTGEITLLNDTITRNQGYKGGGIYGPENANTIENTIVAGNSGGFTADGGGDCYGTQALDNATAADKGGNIDGDGACFSSLVSHDQTGVAPLLGELAANGGPTETDGLLTGSPAIASGVSTPVACPATDQRGATRSGGCYVGAFQGVLAENAGPPVVPSSPVVSGSPVLSAPTVITTTTTVTTQTASATPTECKSQRTETVNWKALAGVHFKDIVVMRGGKTYRDLPGSAREATVSLVGLPKGAVVVKVVGTTRSGERYTMARTYHLCVAARPGGKSASGVLTHA
jgi:predicted outer membrane repeat protein